MLTAVIYALIYVCVAALVLYLVFYVLEAVGVPLPAQAVKIIWIIFMLICLLWVLNAVMSHGGLRLGSRVIEHARVAQWQLNDLPVLCQGYEVVEAKAI